MARKGSRNVQTGPVNRERLARASVPKHRTRNGRGQSQAGTQASTASVGKRVALGSTASHKRNRSQHQTGNPPNPDAVNTEAKKRNTSSEQRREAVGNTATQNRIVHNRYQMTDTAWQLPPVGL